MKEMLPCFEVKGAEAQGLQKEQAGPCRLVAHEAETVIWHTQPSAKGTPSPGERCSGIVKLGHQVLIAKTCRN